MLHPWHPLPGSGGQFTGALGPEGTRCGWTLGRMPPSHGVTTPWLFGPRGPRLGLGPRAIPGSWDTVLVCFLLRRVITVPPKELR